MNIGREIEIVMRSNADWTKFRDKSVLVTGATGRLGIYFVGVLLALNEKYDMNVKVFALCRNAKKADAVFSDYKADPHFHVVVQDITEPIKTEEKVDYIFHTAGRAAPVDYKEPVETMWGHVLGTRNVLEFARNVGCKKIVYISTVETYGTWSGDDTIKETDMGIMRHDNARACYPEAKRLCETMLCCYKKQYDLDFVCVRMSHTFGPGIVLDDGRGFAEFIGNAIRGEDIVLNSDGSAVRTYTYVADAIAAIFLATANGTDNFYNIANEANEISIRNLAQLIVRLSPNPISLKYAKDVKPQLSYLPYRIGILDSSKIKELGWKPEVGLEDAFAWTIESFTELYD